MQSNDRMAIAAHLNILMRRHLSRMTDPEWMAANREYALAMVALARKGDQPELLAWANRLAASYESRSSDAGAAAAPPTPVALQALAASRAAAAKGEDAAAQPGRYVRSLR
jgi:hypothetical protein